MGKQYRECVYCGKRMKKVSHIGFGKVYHCNCIKKKFATMKKTRKVFTIIRLKGKNLIEAYLSMNAKNM